MMIATVTTVTRTADGIIPGRAPKASFWHIAIQEALNGKVVDWTEKVSDEQYRAGSRT